MNLRWSAAENVHALRDCGAMALCVDDAFADQGAALAAQIPGLSLIHIDDSARPEGMLHHATLAANTAPMPDAGCGGSDACAVFYTGSTTGLPKGVAFSHQALCQASVAYLAMLPETEDLCRGASGCHSERIRPDRPLPQPDRGLQVPQEHRLSDRTPAGRPGWQGAEGRLACPVLDRAGAADLTTLRRRARTVPPPLSGKAR